MRNPLTLEAFADWAEKKPPDEAYNYSNWARCPCAQFAAFTGTKYSTPFPVPLWAERLLHLRPYFWRDAERQACKRPHTFGALATRLRAQMDLQP